MHVLGFAVGLVRLLVDLQSLRVDPPTHAREIVTRILPRVRVLHAPADLVHAVKRERDDARREGRDPLEVGGEHEGHRVHEEEQEDVQHVQVLVRDRRGDDALGGLERVEHELAVAEDVQRGSLAEVADPAVVLYDGGYLGHAHVRAIPGLQRLELVQLDLVLDDVRDPGLAAAVPGHQLVVGDGPDVRVPVPLRSNRLSNKGVQQISQAEELHAVTREGSRPHRVLGRPLALVDHRLFPAVPAHRRVRSEKSRGGHVEVAYAGVYGAQRGFALVVSLVREVRAEDE